MFIIFFSRGCFQLQKCVRHLVWQFGDWLGPSPHLLVRKSTNTGKKDVIVVYSRLTLVKSLSLPLLSSHSPSLYLSSYLSSSIPLPLSLSFFSFFSWPGWRTVFLSCWVSVTMFVVFYRALLKLEDFSMETFSKAAQGRWLIMTSDVYTL